MNKLNTNDHPGLLDDLDELLVDFVQYPRIWATSSALRGEKGSRNRLCSPAVQIRRSIPSLSKARANLKLSITTPMEPTRLALSA